MSMAKLRWLTSEMFRQQKYTNSCVMNEVHNIMTLRLHMVKLDCNYGKKDECEVCRKEEETTEHVLKCGRISESVGNRNDNDMNVKTEDPS